MGKPANAYLRSGKMIDLIPFDRAVVCENCQQVSISASTCVGCGSIAIVLLSTITTKSEYSPCLLIDGLMNLVEREMERTKGTNDDRQIAGN
jgi:hypothetical protein